MIPTQKEDFTFLTIELGPGNAVFVAGTTAVDESRKVVGLNDPCRQAVFVYEKINRGLHEAGSSLKDVVRVRTFITDTARW